MCTVLYCVEMCVMVRNDVDFEPITMMVCDVAMQV